MTNREYALAQIGFAPPANVVEAALLDAGVALNTVYDTSPMVAIKTAMINVMLTLLTTADTGNSITGFNQSYDRNAILKRITQLQNELGITTGQPTITGKKPW